MARTAADEAYKPGAVAPTPHPASAAQPRRKAAAGTRTWLVVSENGAAHLEEFGKHAIMRRTGLPGRDLRILDPMLSYPSTILGRERAIVVKLEHIKIIIKATEALVLNPRDRTVEDFVDELQRRVSSNLYPAAPQQAAEGSDNENGTTNKGLWASPASPSSPSSKNANQNIIRNGNEDGLRDLSEASKPMGPKALPFEFRVLEVCLESACRCLENETVALEKEAYPALDELTSKISTLNLERVRQIKSRLVAISGRVQKVRDELEHLLDDDMDMAEMYLTDKLVDERFEQTSSKGENDDNELESDDERYEDYRIKYKSMSGSVTDFKPNIEELEMLLEAYFVQIEGTLNKLSTAAEGSDNENGTTNKGLWASPASPPSSPSSKNAPQNIIRNGNEDGLRDLSEASKPIGLKALPFEFRVLEVCLQSACRCIENETVALENEAYLVLDELTSKIST